MTSSIPYIKNYKLLVSSAQLDVRIQYGTISTICVHRYNHALTVLDLRHSGRNYFQSKTLRNASFFIVTPCSYSCIEHGLSKPSRYYTLFKLFHFPSNSSRTNFCNQCTQDRNKCGLEVIFILTHWAKAGTSVPMVSSLGERTWNAF